MTRLLLSTRPSIGMPLAMGTALLWLMLASACSTPPAPVLVTDTPFVGHPQQVLPGTPSLIPFPTTVPPASATPPAAVSSTVVSFVPRTGAAIGPILQLIAPSNNAQVSLNQSVNVVAVGASENGITRIELWADNVLVQSQSAPTPVPSYPAVLSWTAGQLGNHVLRVIAYDTNNAASTPVEITVSVVPDARRPLAYIVFPIGLPQVELGNILQVQAVASDEAGVVQFDLWADDKLYTYILSKEPKGQTLLPAVFAWTALTPGNHTLLVRSHDSQDQTADSSPLRVFVADTHSPAVSTSLDRTNALVGEPVTITMAAVDISGIQRIELWTGHEISNTFTSASPARQTYMTVQVPWQSNTPGDYTISARAYSTNGNAKDSPVQVLSVLRPGQATPTRASTPTLTRTREPRVTLTPPLQPPAPPSAQVSQPQDRFSNQWPVHVSFSGQGNAELDRIELWGYYQGQPNPQLVCTLEAHASTQKSGQCDWSPPDAGLVYLFAQAIDIYKQVGRSATISGFIGVPGTATPTPTPSSIAGRWTGSSTAAQFAATLRQTGGAVRGDFKLTASGSDTLGRITYGSIRGDRVTFHVDFGAPVTPAPTSSGDAATPTPSATLAPTLPAIDFDCGLDASATTLDCKFINSRGQTGATLLRRE